MRKPLAKLLLKNVQDAAELSLLPITSVELTRVQDAIDTAWDEAATERDRFARASELVRSELGSKYLTLGSFTNRALVVSRVFPVRFLHYLFGDLKRRCSPGTRTQIVQALADLEMESRRPVSEDQNPAQEAIAAAAERSIEAAVEFLRSKVCSPAVGQKGERIYAKNLVASFASCWVARRSASKDNSSQYWRDRLGLEHYPHGEGDSWSRTVGDRLIRVTFVARTSVHKLPLSGWEALASAHPKDLWVSRPTVANGGNMRFLQRHAADRQAATSKYGRTIDLKDTKYDSAEREWILHFGDQAQLQWRDLELLDGFPQRNAHDLDHAGFVSTIEQRC